MTGAELLALRKRLRLTQAALALALGMSVSQVGDYERGKRGSRHQVLIPRVVELALECLEARYALAREHELRTGRASNWVL